MGHGGPGPGVLGSRGHRSRDRTGQAPLRRGARLPCPVRTAVLRRAQGGNLRRHSSGGSPLQRAAQGGSDGPDRHQAGAGPRRELDRVQGRTRLHVQAEEGRQVPRRQRDDLEGRQGLLRQDHLPAGRRPERPEGSVRGRRGGGGSGSLHSTVQAQVAGGLLPRIRGLALELDLQGRHPGEGSALVRDPRHGDRALSSSWST